MGQRDVNKALPFTNEFESSEIRSYTFSDERFNQVELGLVYMRRRPHLPDPGLRGEIPPSNRILCKSFRVYTTNATPPV